MNHLPHRPPHIGDSPWAAPDPRARLDQPAAFVAPATVRVPSTGNGRRLVAALAVAGLILGAVGYSVLFGGGTNRTASVARTTVPVTVPTTVPTTSPTSIVPRTTVPGTSTPRTTAPGVTVPGATSPSSSPSTVPGATPSTTPRRPATTPATAPVGGNQQTGLDSKLTAGLVNIYTVLGYQQAQAAGTGMVLSADGAILTNNHVIDGSTKVKVEIVATGETFDAKVVGTDRGDDVAVVQLVDASGLTPIKLGSSASVKVGDPVTAVGNAGGRGTPTVAPGEVAALDQTITASDETGSNVETLTGLIQVTANLQAGESGGPLFDAAAAVVGMDTAGSAGGRFRAQAGSGEGYAIPIDHALSIAKNILAGNAVDGILLGTPGFLGVATDDGVSVAGAQISQVVAGSPAAGAGLQVGDVITAVDATPVTGTESLRTALHAHKGGDSVTLTIVDAANATINVKVTLVEGPAN